MLNCSVNAPCDDNLAMIMGMVALGFICWVAVVSVVVAIYDRYAQSRRKE